MIESEVKAGVAVITVHPAKGSFDGFEKNKATEFRINVSSKPKKVTAIVGSKTVTLKPVLTANDFATNENVYFYSTPDLNQFATAGSAFEKIRITKNPQLQVKLASADIIKNRIKLTVEGFVFASVNKLKQKTGVLPVVRAVVTEKNSGPFTLKPSWVSCC